MTFIQQINIEPEYQIKTKFEINKTYIHTDNWCDDNLGSITDLFYYKITKKTAKTVWWKKVFRNGTDFTSNHFGEKMEGKSLIKISDKRYEDNGEHIEIKDNGWGSTTKIWSRNIQEEKTLTDVMLKLKEYGKKKSATTLGKKNKKIKIIKDKKLCLDCKEPKPNLNPYYKPNGSPKGDYCGLMCSACRGLRTRGIVKTFLPAKKLK